jgi:hypothetical protein
MISLKQYIINSICIASFHRLGWCPTCAKLNAMIKRLKVA